MTTPRALIVRALRKSGVNGVGQTATTDDLNDALDDLNGMTAQWARRRWLVPHLTEIVFMPSGKASYTIGNDITADLYTPRPDRIENAFVRYAPDGVMPADFPLDILDAVDDYNRITLKSYSTVPVCLYYEPAYPLGKLFLWPNQGDSGAAELHLFVKGTDLSTAWSLDDTILLPPEYDEALLYNLAARLRFSYQLPPDGTLAAMALTSLSTIRQANAQIPRSLMPDGLPGMRRRTGAFAGLFAGNSGGTSPHVFRVDISTLDGPDAVT